MLTSFFCIGANTASAGRAVGFGGAADAVLLVDRVAEVASREEHVNWLHGREADAQDADCVFDNGPDTGFRSGPSEIRRRDSLDCFDAIYTGYTDAVVV